VNLFVIVAVLVIATIIGAIGIRMLLRRLLSRAQAEQAEHTVPFLLGSIGGFFGLVGGLLLSTSWGAEESQIALPAGCLGHVMSPMVLSWATFPEFASRPNERRNCRARILRKSDG
jgi:O-antigen/teichoic acid export membrane protein